ncbi:hypothetical protein H9Y04_43375 [Streptomyces sp. TRM66268-LWL]|uniref:Uncharacterized protein n=1 Tax=Streptomyces polyasparticus TaxID=2767826 RepID=A0ABR7SVE8_9ACTN|nr:hypothetical protein [Streptomyces polyasparticus]MBC9719373.1 hypothetical protein [Streptomyces polyasparticus]
MERRPALPDPAMVAAEQHVPAPGTRLLVDHLDCADPHTELAARHPPGDRAHRLVSALLRTAAELDDAYRDARQAGTLLRERRSRIHDTEAPIRDPGVLQTAHDLEHALQRCESTDTALVRLLAVYLDLVRDGA